MKRKRFSVEQIVAVLKQAEIGSAGGGTDPAGGDQRADAVSLEEAVQGAGNRPGPPVQTTAGRERAAEAGGSRADLGQGDAAGRAGKKTVTPSRRRPVVSYLHDTYRVSERRACRVARMAVSTFRYESRQEPRTALRLRIREIAQTRVRYGYRKIRVLLKREGWKVGKKLVYRLYREEGLTLRHKPRRKRRAAMHRRERFRPTAPNQVWSLDFVADQLADGRRFRALTILDIFTRESLAIEVGQKLKGEDVVGALNQIRQKRGTPKLLFCDNGSEFTSQMMDLWAYHNQVQIDFSRPGKPTDNAYVESFNGTLRAECLDVHWFATLTEAKQVIEGWRREYNDSRPHRSLGERTPSEFACQIALNGDLPSSQTVGNSP